LERLRKAPDLTDRELLSRYLNGEVGAFEAILDRYERPLLRFAARYRAKGDDGWTEDIVQEVFLRFLKEGRKLGSVENISAWLYRVARNLAIDEARKEIRMERRHRLRAEAEVQAPPPSQEETSEVSGIVSEKLMGLPPNQRDVLILKIQEGRSYREISEITGLTTSNIGYLIHHGLKALASELRTAGIV
jgi:RNA polymerase sigma-70 factor (ECF subfamily)